MTPMKGEEEGTVYLEGHDEEGGREEAEKEARDDHLVEELNHAHQQHTDSLDDVDYTDLESATIGPVSGSRYMARLCATGAKLGQDTIMIFSRQTTVVASD